jgi:hypothetical protein
MTGPSGTSGTGPRRLDEHRLNDLDSARLAWRRHNTLNSPKRQHREAVISFPRTNEGA